MSEHTSRYRPDSTFAYPYAYSVQGDPSLSGLDNASYYRSDIPTDLRFSSLDSLIKWSKSAPGSWQAQQTARYSNFHRDLPEALIPSAHEGLEDEFRLTMLKFMALGMEELSYESARTDFHPLGHMANVACYLDTVLRRTMSFHELTPDAIRMIDINRHAAVLHDIGEIEHPGAVINHGKVVGDISSATGKTSEERQKERAIFADVLTDVFGDDYDPEFIDSMTRLVSHDLEGADKAFIEHHDRLEIAHHLNSANTAIYLGHLACRVPDEYGNFLSVLAGQGVKILANKFNEVSERSPEVSAKIQDDIDWSMRQVKSEAHSRDENEDWLKWRMSDRVVAHYGEYTPWTF